MLVMAERTTFQSWLRGERIRVGLSQEELSVAAGLGSNYVNKIEKRRVDLPTMETRLKLHKVLGTSDNDLVEAGILAPEYSTVNNRVNEGPTAYRVESSAEDLREEAIALIGRIKPDYLADVVRTLRIMSQAR